MAVLAEPGAPDTTPGSGRLLLFALVAAGVVVADQAGKAWAVAAWKAGTSPGSGPLGAALLRNPGASFGLGASWTLLISVVTLVAVPLLVVAGVRSRGRVTVAALALMAGGAAGNGLDRLLRAPGPLRGAVVDWIKVPGYPAVFNLADVALRLGALLVLAAAVNGWRARTWRGSGPAAPAPLPRS
jgi:signal peptidase II